MATFYDHRAADVVKSPTAVQRQRQPRYLSSDEKENPARVALPLDWVSEAFVRERVGAHAGWLLGFNEITSATNERTTICSALPVTAVGHKEPLARAIADAHFLLAALNSFVLDYVARQKIGGTSLNYFHLRQLPVPLPNLFKPHSRLIDFAVLELVYTAWDMVPFADTLGYVGPPFRWNNKRRSLIRAELDALVFHLFGLGRSDTEYIMDTFTTLKRKEEKQHGEFRTKRLILNCYDAMTQAYALTHGTVETPNGQNPPVDRQALASYSTRLAEALQANYRINIDPPPAHPSCAHPESTRPPWALEYLH